MSQWNIDGPRRQRLSGGRPWHKELVRVLLPALPLDPTPSPAHVWPEVDKLVRLLAETIDNPTVQALDPHLLDVDPFVAADPECQSRNIWSSCCGCWSWPG